jgi:hypothetical protein
MKHYRYVILSSYGASWDIFREIDKPLGGLMQLPWFGDLRFQDRQDLLDKGWSPVRETGMGGASATGGAGYYGAICWTVPDTEGLLYVSSPCPGRPRLQPPQEREQSPSCDFLPAR